eukprot:354727-Chlamydomonas_euryale.AAC.1
MTRNLLGTLPRRAHQRAEINPPETRWSSSCQRPIQSLFSTLPRRSHQWAASRFPLAWRDAHVKAGDHRAVVAVAYVAHAGVVQWQQLQVRRGRIAKEQNAVCPRRRALEVVIVRSDNVLHMVQVRVWGLLGGGAKREKGREGGSVRSMRLQSFDPTKRCMHSCFVGRSSGSVPYIYMVWAWKRGIGQSGERMTYKSFICL